jgi:glutathione S-transferase
MSTRAAPVPSLWRLITIPFSHYCEKARWALDHTGAPYVEDPYLPGLHIRPARRAGGRSVPVLVTPERTLTDSSDILRHCDAMAPADRKLYPRDPLAKREVETIEALCNGPLGLSSRVFVYHHALPTPWSLLRMIRPGLTKAQALVFPFVLPLVRPRIRRMYRVDAPNAAEALEKIHGVFAELGARLKSGPWLVGDGLTAADITFASLAAPMLGPAGHPAMSGAFEEVPEPLRSIMAELRATLAGEHALRLYRTHRGKARGKRG